MSPKSVQFALQQLVPVVGGEEGTEVGTRDAGHVQWHKLQRAEGDHER